MSSELAVREPTTMEMIQQVLSTPGDPVQMATVVKELVALRQSEERFKWEREERQAKIDFDNSLNECQGQIERIAPNADRENGIKWLDYKGLDKVIRPIYIKAGFSISFSEAETADSSKLRMKATVSRGGISKEYFAEISRTPTNSKMNVADAAASAASRVKRYLLLDIFNVAVGIDADEKQPYKFRKELNDLIDQIGQCGTLADAKEAYGKAFAMAREEGSDAATIAVIDAFEKAKKELKK